MKFKLITLAASVSLLAGGLAYADGPSFYGRADVAVQKTNKESTTAKDAWELVTNASRFGVKGSEALDPDSTTTAFYQFEWGVDVTGDATTTTNLSARNQFAGLHSDQLGDIMIGRMDTPLKNAQKSSKGSVDLFDDHAGDMAGLLNSASATSGEVRQPNALAYRSNKIADSLQFNVLVSPGENVNIDGNAGNETGLADAYSASATYEKDNVYGAVAYDSSINAWDHIRAVGALTLGDLQLGGLYQTGKDTATATDLKTDGYLLSAAYALDDGGTVLKAEYGANTEKTASTKTGDRTLIGVGVEKKFTKKAKVYAEYVKFDESVSNKTDTYLTLGTQINF